MKRDCPVEADGKTAPTHLYLTYISGLLSVSSEIVPFISIPPYFQNVEEKRNTKKTIIVSKSSFILVPFKINTH